MKADEQFLNDTLGILKPSEQQKFKYELSKAKLGSVGRQYLHGWGNNQFGQLAIWGSNIPGPKEIPLPDFKDP